MSIARMQMRFRKEIRCRELEAYKEKVRQHFLAHNHHQILMAEQIEVECESTYVYAGERRSDDQFRKIQTVLYDFQCNYNQAELQEQLAPSNGEDSDFSNSSRSSRLSTFQKSSEQLSLSELEMIGDACLKAQLQRHLFMNVLECLESVPRIFYSVMDKYLPQLAQERKPNECRLFNRLKRVWTVCQKLLVSCFTARMLKEELLREEMIFLVELSLYKILYLHKYDLLGEKNILTQSFINFNFLFELPIDSEDPTLTDKIRANFLFLKNFDQVCTSLPTAIPVLLGFIKESVTALGELELKFSPNNYTLEFIDCFIALLQIFWKLLAHIQKNQNNLISINQQKTVVIERILRLGAVLSDFQHLEAAELKQYLILNLLLLIRNSKLYEESMYFNQINRICSSTIFSSEKSELMELWALEILARTRQRKLLLTLHIHYTFKARTAAQEEREHYDLCLQFIHNALNIFDH